MAGSDTAKLIAELSLKDKLTPGVNSALKSVGRLERGLGRSAKGVGQLGLGMGKVLAFGAGVAAVALGGATKAAIDFEDAFAGVKKTVDETDLEKAGLSFDKLKKQFIDLSTQIPVTASDLARIGEAAGALGIRATDISKFSETVAKLGATTNLTTDEAANSLGKIGTILNLTGSQFEEFGDILVNLGNKGASTEAEIIEVTKRFAAAGKSAGLSTQQILAFASAISSAGVEPEAAGSALSRLFGKIVQDTALGTTAAKNFAKTSGKSFADWSKLVEKDTTGAMLAFLKSLKGLSKFEQSIALEKVGITNVRDINAIRLLAQTYEKNLIPALQNAQTATGALDKESQVRFNTIRSKFQLLRNAFVKGGLTIGDGFLPALGRLTTKVTDWVNLNSGKLEQVGKDIGKALDDIDWKEVERGANRVADAAKVILDVVKQIPTEVKLGGAALIGLDKLSGGLIGKGLGNIAGGAVDAFTKQFLARGSSPANPVWVAGTGLGGPGGAAGAGGLGAFGKAVVGGIVIGGVALSLDSIQQLANENAAAAAKGLTPAETAAMRYYTASIADQELIKKRLGEIPSKAEWLSALAKLGQTAPGTVTPKGPVGATGAPRPAGSDTFRSDAPEKRDWRHADAVRTATAVEKLHGDIGPSLSQVPSKLDALKAGQATDAQIVKAAVARAGIETKTATIGAGVAARLAGERTTAATHGVARAVDRKDLSVTLAATTHVGVRFSIREQANAVSSRTVHKIL